jgi:hypothetical protein
MNSDILRFRLYRVHSDFGAMLLSDKPGLAKVAAAAMAKGFAAAIFAISFIPRHLSSVDRPPWSMAGFLLPLLPLPRGFCCRRVVARFVCNCDCDGLSSFAKHAFTCTDTML